MLMVLSFGLLAGCSKPVTDQSLMADDKQILADFETLQQRFNGNEISRNQFKSGLEKLQGREGKIFDEARHHKFSDRQAANYFYRMRLKFPSPISETLKDIS